jgi:uncharacterized protein YkwD
MKRRIILAFLFAILLTIIAVPAAAAGWEPDEAVSAAAMLPSETAGQKEEPDFKAELFRLVNEERERLGLHALAGFEKLDEISSVRAFEAADTFSHTRPNGESCGTIFGEFGLSYEAAGENLSFGFISPKRLFDAWMASPSHRENIVNPGFAFAGIGYEAGEDGKMYCSLLFYTPALSQNE